MKDEEEETELSIIQLDCCYTGPSKYATVFRDYHYSFD